MNKENKENKVYCVNTTADLVHLKSLYIKELNDKHIGSFESTAVKRMYRYKFLQDSELKSLRLQLNPHLVFFENRITDENTTLNKGLCVMYPSTLVTGEIDGHIKFVGNSGVLLYTLFKQKEKTFYGFEEIMSLFRVTFGELNTELAIQKLRRIIEMYITDLLLIIGE